MKVKFLYQCVVKAVNGETFEEGKTYDLPPPSALHWIKRGKAIALGAEPEPKDGAKARNRTD